MSVLPISVRLLLSYLLVAVLPLSGLAWYYLDSFEASLQTTLLKNMADIADRKAGQIDSYMSERLSDARLLGQQKFVRESIAVFGKAFREGGMQSNAYRVAEQRVRPELEAFAGKAGYWDLLLVDNGGNVVFSIAREVDLGTSLKSGPYRTTQLAQGFDLAQRTLQTNLSRFQPYAPSGNRPAAFLVAPVLENGVVNGALALQVDLSALETVTTDTTGMGRTGETVLAQKDGGDALFTAPLKNRPEAAFNYRIPLRDAPSQLRQALSGAHDHGVVRDYDGKEVIAAWRYLPALRWGMVVKMDIEEAMAPAIQLRRIAYFALALFLLLSGAMAYFLGWQLSRPIRNLTHTAESISHGDLSQRAPHGGADELGRMANAFNRMTDALLDARHNLEAKVAERTAELQSISSLQHAILDNAAYSIIATTPEGTIKLFNRAAERMLGYRADEVVGRMTPAVIHDPEEVAERARIFSEELGTSLEPGFEVFVAHARRGLPSEFEWIYIRKDGSRFPVLLSVTALRSESGIVTGFLGIAVDISERKQAEEALRASEARLKEAQRTAQIGNWELDLVSGSLHWSDEIFRIFEIDKERFGASYEVFLNGIHPDDREKVNQAYTESLANHTAYEIAHRLLMPNGRIKWVNERCQTYYGKDGEALRSTGTVQDITANKVTEAALVEAKQAAEAASQAKSSFLANMSHEIRTPMNAILGLTRLVLESGELKPQQEDYLRKAQASSGILLGILNDILDYSKLEAGRMTIEHMPLRVEEILQDVAGLFGAQIEQKGLELFFDIGEDAPAEISGDPLRLMQVLNNLVGNAVKFTERGEIHVKVEVARLDGADVTLRFSVRDTGVGLSKETAARLFQPFTQADASITRRYGGTGLGLAISQRLVEMMGGEITVSSIEGQGSVFTFTLPARVLSSADQDLQQISGLKVLAVDDHETSRLMFKRLLESWRLEAHIASSGEEALACIEEAERRQQPFDAVLLDWRMPGMSGLDVARQLEERAARGKIAHPLLVVMATAFNREELLAQAGSLRIDGVLSKPVAPSHLFDMLLNARNRQAMPYCTMIAGAHLPMGRFDGARVLVVEDNKLNQEVAAAFLQRRGVAVTLASNGSEAVEWVQREQFDMVLMDLHMPVMDGFEAARRILKLSEGQSLPVVAMTAAVMPEDRKRCAEAGMAGFIAKPVDPGELTRCLQKWLQAYEQREAAPSASAQGSVLPDHLPGFDLAQALGRMDNDQALLARLLRSFAEEQAETLAQLDALLQEGKTGEAAALLHTLKGVAGNLGASALAQAVKQMELEIKAGGPLLSRPVLDEQLKTVLASIAVWRETSREETAAPAKIDKEELAGLLNALMPYLQERELAPDELMQQLQRQELAGPSGKLLEKLIRLIDQFDHDGALSAIAQLAAELKLELHT